MPKIVDKDEKKKKILHAAIKEFAAKGFAGANISGIAEKADMGKGTIYEYFRSKDELISNAFYLFMDEVNTTIAKRIYNIYDPIEKLKAFFDAWIDFLDSPFKNFIEVMLDFWAEGIRNKNQYLKFDLKKMYSEYRLMIQNFLDDCIVKNELKEVNTHISSSIIIGALDGLWIQWIVEKNVFNIKEAIELLKNMIIDGLEK